MLMNIDFPPVCVVFFAGILEFVNFDLLPTEDIYAKIFGFENEPYSDEADNIGYGSRFFIENAGSIPIYIGLEIILQILFALTRLIFKPGRVHDFAARRQ